MDLLQEIAHCPKVEYCKTHPSSGHPCAPIVESQGSVLLADHQVPEPWSGHLEDAPILFLSSNPSIGGNDDYYPRWSWSDERTRDFFANRFGGGGEEWIRDGRYPLIAEGVQGTKPVPFWSAIRLRAAELLDVEAIKVRPGIDYCTSEVVHCKSQKQRSVAAAFDTCVGLYLEKMIAQSGAKVIVSLGVHAARAVRQTFDVPGGAKVYGPIPVGQKGRMFAFLPHPAAFKMSKSFAHNLTPDELEEIRAFACQGNDQ